LPVLFVPVSTCFDKAIIETVDGCWRLFCDLLRGHSHHSRRKPSLGRRKLRTLRLGCILETASAWSSKHCISTVFGGLILCVCAGCRTKPNETWTRDNMGM
jgi:hypothetical protein